MRTVAQINHHSRQGFVHRQIRASVAADAFLATKRFAQTITQHNAGVLDGVMHVDLNVTHRSDVEIKESVFGKKREHVIEKRSTRVDRRFTRAVNQDREINLRLGGLAVALGTSW